MQNDALDGQPLGWFSRLIGRRRKTPGVADQAIDAQALESRTLYSATPLVLDAVKVDVSEDAPNTNLDLRQYFTVDDGHQHVDYSLVGETGDHLFAAKTLGDHGQLSLDYAKDHFGEARLTLLASNASGQAESLPIHVVVRPLNDSPTTTGLVDVSVEPGTGRTVVDLFSAFDDVEDGSQGLTYSVAENTNPQLFDSVHIDQQHGRLILDYADGHIGSSDLTILATDSGGLSVGLSSDGFTIHDQIFARDGSEPDTSYLGLQPSELWTSGRFHDEVNGEYQFDYVNFDKLDRYLATADPSHYHVFNIENPYYDNSPEGRDRFAELLSYVKQQRPDLEIGVYRIMPEAQWYAPVAWHTSQLHESLGITSWYTRNATEFHDSYNNWLVRNSLFRTEQVSDQYGGGTVSGLVDGINPHLYTFRLGNADVDAPIWHLAILDASANTITVDGPSFADVETVQLEFATDATLENGLHKLTEYHVVNAHDTTFQLALTEGGKPINFDGNFSGRIYVGATDFSSLWHDPNVLNWKVYAEENIAEAHKYGKPVYPYLSPSLKGTSAQPLSYEFFRWQLEVIRPIADGVVIYEAPTFDGAHHVQQEWWRALEDFAGTLNGPSGSFTVSVTPGPNVAPVAHDDSLTAVEDTPTVVHTSHLLQNDVDSDPLSVARFSQPEHGKLTKLPDGSLRYVPDEDFHGVDQFRYIASDGHVESNPATVRIAVAARNDAPVAHNDNYAVLEDSTRTIDIDELISNDVDVDGDALSLHVVVAPKHGSVELTHDGELVYTPQPDYHGNDSFRYRVSDGETVSNAALVVMNVLPVNDEPSAASDALRTKEDTPLVIESSDLTRNDHDPDNDLLRIVPIAQPLHGNLGRNADGDLIYRPHRNFHGVDQFEYFVSDGIGRSEAVTVQLRVSPVNDSPHAVGDRFALRDGRVLRVSEEDGVLANDRDPDGNTLRARLLRAASHGQVRLNLDGSFTYRASNGYAGLDQFSYVIYDGKGGRNVGDVRIHVAQDDEPRRVGETVRNPRDLSGDLLHQVERMNRQRPDWMQNREQIPAWLRGLRRFRSAPRG